MPDIALSADLLGMLFMVAALAGFVDSLAGGGGLITIPSLLLAQIPPVHALATNKLQGSFGTLTATLAMLKTKNISLRETPPLFIAAFIGAGLGTLAIQSMPLKALDVVIPIILTIIAVYFLVMPKAGEVERAPRLGEKAYRFFVIPIIGFYDGFFGPGTGSFFSLAGVSLRGYTLLRATALAKMLNFATNFASVIVFVLGGKVVWAVGAVMIVGQVLGASVGSFAMVKGGARLIRPLIVIVCLVMLGRYFWQKGLLPIF